jgi:hypothetical protein
LVSVTRDELAEILEARERAREERHQERHQENLTKFDDLFERMGGVETTVAEMKGVLSERFPRAQR